MDNRIRELEESLAATLGFLPEIDIAASIVVAVVVVVGLVILARRPDVTRRTRKSRESRQRRKAMQSSPSSSTAGGTGFSVRWGRLAIFGIGALALVVAVICAIAGLFGAATWLAAGMSLLIVAASYGVLRGLVVMGSKNRAREREQLSRAEGFDTSIAQYTTQTDEHQTYVNTNDEVFDVADQPAEESTETVAAPVAQEPTETVSAPVPSGTPVPRPMYLDAPEVEREAPAPLETPQEPTPSPGVQLSEGVSSQYQEQITQKANTRLDLDKVLNRRRAI